MIAVCLQKVQDLATALLVSDPNSFQVACHTLLGAVTILHETCGHTFRTRHFSTTEFRSPPAYRSVNDATKIKDQVLWKDGITGGGDSGFWAEDSGLGGALGCSLSGTMVCT